MTNLKADAERSIKTFMAEWMAQTPAEIPDEWYIPVEDEQGNVIGRAWPSGIGPIESGTLVPDVKFDAVDKDGAVIGTGELWTDVKLPEPQPNSLTVTFTFDYEAFNDKAKR